MIALAMMRMSFISMSIFAECIEFASTHQLGKIDFARGKYLETKWLQERLDVCAENLNFLGHTCELCNEHGHLTIRCKLFHDLIVSKNCDDLISLAHHNEHTLLMGYEEMKRITNYLLVFARE